MEDGIYAKITTEKGEIIARLLYNEAPLAVSNFVGLAEGDIENDVVEKGQPFYDGLKFHRVINDFMVQGGDPTGTGAGGPGYRFPDEFHPDLRHDSPGTLSMANAGADTNGSQFFITHLATPWLDDKHTVFGEVVEGMDVVNSIKQDDTMKRVEILRVGTEAQAWDAKIVFDEFMAKAEELKGASQRRQKEKVAELTQGFLKTDSGLYYKKEKESTGESPAKNDEVSVHYKGMLLSGKVFDDSHLRNEPISFTLGEGRVIMGWEEGIALLKEGEKARFVIPPEMGYGPSGAAGIIPPNAWLVFDVELVKVNKD